MIRHISYSIILAQEEPWGGMKKVYTDKEEAMFMFCFKCLKAIFYAPIDEMEGLFQTLVKSQIWDHRLDEYCNKYFLVSFYLSKNI